MTPASMDCNDLHAGGIISDKKAGAGKTFQLRLFILLIHIYTPKKRNRDTFHISMEASITLWKPQQNAE
jgi:hypothetical protein